MFDNEKDNELLNDVVHDPLGNEEESDVLIVKSCSEQSEFPFKDQLIVEPNSAVDNIGVNNSVSNNVNKLYTTKTYYKKTKKNIPALVSAIIAIFVIAAIGITGFYYANKSKNYDVAPETAHKSDVPTKASTLEQLAKKEGSEMSIVDIANKVGPAVCGITVTQQVQTFFGSQYVEGSGSGIIISEDGYIVTNQHVIENASEITVILSTGQEYEAQLVGQDPQTDLAVVKIDGKGLPVAEFGYSSELAVGELAIAIGNPLGQEFAGSVTVGVISALNRSVTVEDRTYTLIQTDAAINSGNSGGALVNSFGQVVGINSLKVMQAEGLGFAIPIDFAKPIIDDLIANGYVKGRPVIGVSLREVDEAMSQQYGVPEGLFVVSVTEFSAAEKCGILQGDVIVKADGQKVSTVAELNDIKNKKRAGDTIKLEIKRSIDNDFTGKWSDKTIEVILGEEIISQ